MRSTIRDVARKADVSKGTVSKVLNGRSGVSQETATRVLEACRELHYQPHPIARRLALRETGNIGITWLSRGRSPIVHSFYNEIIEAILMVLEEAELNLVILPPPQINKDDIKLPSGFSSEQLDGILLIGPMSEPVVERVSKTGVPIVLVDDIVNNKKLYSVSNDNEAGAKKATRYLFSLGHRRIGLIVNSADTVTFNREVLNGYTTAHGERNLPIDEDLVDTWDGTIIPVERVLSVDPPPSALFVSVDKLAMDTTLWLKERNMNVPKDISVVGMDDVPEAQTSHPPLTTVRLERGQLGDRAAKVLLRIIKGTYHGPRQLLLPAGDLKVRESTASVYAST